MFIERGLDSFAYVPARDGYNSGEVLATVTGTPAISGSGATAVLRLTSATVAGVAAFTGHLHETMRLTIPTAPTAGDSRKWGLRNIGMGDRNAIMFEIDGAVFRAAVYDVDGALLYSKTISWDAAWTATEVGYTIQATPNCIRFLINNVLQPQCSFEIPLASVPSTMHQPLFFYIFNDEADNMDLKAINVLKASNLS